MTIDKIISNAIQEDIGNGDHTTMACIPANAKGKAKLLIKEKGILAGVAIAKKVFEQIDPEILVETLIKDGAEVENGDIAFNVSGSSRGILHAERLVLNIMQRMSGIASHTNKLIRLIESFPTKILDTRKTTPNFRVLEKMAVKIGGGENHRYGLYDMMMIKDNHIDYAGSIKAAITACKKYQQIKAINLPIEVEARNLNEVKQILSAGSVDRIMLDNFGYEELKKAVKLIGNSAETEASGGITESSIRKYAECGVDFISIGALTHQINSLDMSLKAKK